MWKLSPDIDLSSENIPAADAERQRRTAAEILERLAHRPGQVLADEVGMGKTFVALAIAASVVRATRYEQPVVVMVPSSVVDKWPRDWNSFALGLSDASDIKVSGAIRHGTDFLKLLDDPPDRRSHIIFLTHGALTRTINDPFVKLSLLKKAVGRRKDLQNRLPAIIRDAATLVSDKRFNNTPLVTELLNTHERHWMKVWNNHSAVLLDDDPVPLVFADAIDSKVLEPLRDALVELPINRSSNFEKRLGSAKKALAAAMRGAWEDGLRKLDLTLPLLILDEAHHVKNDNTMAALFANDAADTDLEALRGPLGGIFERMLFLTATPFQLGHHELLSVLGRFTGVRWESAEDRAAFEASLDDIGTALDTAQAAAATFQKRWSALDPREDAALSRATNFEEPLGDELSAAGRAALHEGRVAQSVIGEAERKLRPWIIRHLKTSDTERRQYRAGAAVVSPGAVDRGLPVDDDAALPFLLAGRADAVSRLTKTEGGATRSLFSYGIASSYETYLRTRATGQSDLDDAADASTQRVESPEVQWYLDRIAQYLPDDPEKLAAHPKIAATVKRTVQLWSAGHKVLIFCFYQETGRALRLHIARALERRTLDLARVSMSMDGQSDNDVKVALDRLSDRLFRSDTSSFRRLRAEIESWLPALDKTSRELLVDIVIRFLRTQSFLVRFAAPNAGMTVDDLWSVVDSASPGSVSLKSRVISFATFLSRRTAEDRGRILDVLATAKTGDITIDDFDPAENSSQHVSIAPNVRLANGQVGRETRQKLMASFNSPFFPDVLVASSIMAEGVDLHTACRHVIHHDLDWNPATLEQRTGRLDRLGSAAILEKQPIAVDEPYLGGTHDEKMYRVVKARERWFGVVMGDSRTVGAAGDQSLDLPLPHSLARLLTMDFSTSGQPPASTHSLP
ncbi:Helicase conserved C-terminal domain-containing protein [Rhodococcoides kroppenstedtii]|uniref:Helicase conserved C-terminal domain-containing protein n=1 Tax=Rhodococcoides kroppenstedtii TaxID=293050 RepID=A0A1I0TXI6_9NOCA|nr:C-terminal helicase domain-containing protein [Rhodococcus kroppenstedtii]SFA56445.1 Helicase conserved C-terminal domain-containing protein [Rhodococcus kroppenstedtii]